jgi:hypothetical protein
LHLLATGGGGGWPRIIRLKNHLFICFYLPYIKHFIPRLLFTGGSFQQQLITNLLAMGQIDQQLLNFMHNRKDLLFRQHLKNIESKYVFGPILITHCQFQVNAERGCIE